MSNINWFTFFDAMTYGQNYTIYAKNAGWISNLMNQGAGRRAVESHPIRVELVKS